MSINETLRRIKTEYEAAIISATFSGGTYDDGLRAKEALIRSQRLINHLHDFIKREFIDAGVNPNKIIPRLNSGDSEMNIEGFFKPKKQDVCLVPNIYDKSGTEKIITINVRSQLSSLNKNIDTLHERTFAEALNLHLKYPKQCLGEVYLIPTHEYDDKAMKYNRVSFKKVRSIERYVRIFQAINSRFQPDGNEYKYERVALLIVDFRQKIPQLYSNVDELIADGVIAAGTDVAMENLTIENFASDLLDIYSRRFDSLKLQ